MEILLINLCHPGIRPQDRQEHLGLGYLAAVLRQHSHEVRILDAAALRLSDHNALKRAIGKPQADLIGVSIPFQERLRHCLRFVSALRKEGFRGPIVAGGHPPTFLYRSILENCPELDVVVVGEAEQTMVDLARDLPPQGEWRATPGVAYRSGDQVVVNPPRPLASDLNALPFPARDTLPLYLAAAAPGDVPAASVLRSRGCTAHCSFCDTRAFYSVARGHAWRVRSATNVTDEMQWLRDESGVQFIRFWDDNFMGPGRRGLDEVKALAREIISRDLGMGFALECRVDSLDEEGLLLLKEAGLKRVFLGIESGVQRALDTYDKRVTVEANRRALRVLKALGIDVTVGFIMFDPYTTVEELAANTEFLRDEIGPWSEVKRIVAQPMNALQVYDGTPLAGKLKDNGMLLNSDEACPPEYRYRFLDWRVGFLVRFISGVRKVGLPVRDALTSIIWRVRPQERPFRHA